MRDSIRLAMTSNNNSNTISSANLYFGHAETIIPLAFAFVKQNMCFIFLLLFVNNNN